MLIHAVLIIHLIALGEVLNARLIHYRLNNSFNFRIIFTPVSYIQHKYKVFT